MLLSPHVIYAINLFDLAPGKEDLYRHYTARAGKLIHEVGGKVVAAGHDSLRLLAGDLERRCFILVEFPDLQSFDRFHEAAERMNLHPEREASTKNYIWQLFSPWDLRQWIKQGAY